MSNRRTTRRAPGPRLAGLERDLQTETHAGDLRTQIAAAEALEALASHWEETPREPLTDIIERMPEQIRDTAVKLAALAGHATMDT